MNICVNQPQRVNSMGFSDAMWWHRSWSTLIQIRACCMRAPSHYLNQCSLIIHNYSLYIISAYSYFMIIKFWRKVIRRFKNHFSYISLCNVIILRVNFYYSSAWWVSFPRDWHYCFQRKTTMKWILELPTKLKYFCCIFLDFKSRSHICEYIQDVNLVTTVPADVLAPLGARTSAATVMTIKFTLKVFSFFHYE